MKRENKEEEEKEKSTNFAEDADEEKREQKIDEDEMPFRAAKQLFNEKKFETKREGPKQDVKTIEDSIKKAIEEEKKVIVMDS